MNTAPLVKVGLISGEINLVIAGLIGFGFGFMLERAGFGSAKILAAQWYGKNWSVFRVMFTAVFTAALGIIILDSAGVMPLDSLYINKTYLPAQISGGLIMGAGFVIGGYCPGTSFVGLASGKLDAIYYILGMIIGFALFAETYPLVETFMHIGAMGKATFPEVLGLSPWIVVTLVLLMLIGGSIAASYFEKVFNR
ncbi:MAG: YeeE/YedE family protein [Proteobacteria bacterium]|nr:YeeE/YedE family protein [Pseudomonadota bacterium]